jgi:hypothetical protein
LAHRVIDSLQDQIRQVQNSLAFPPVQVLQWLNDAMNQ